jgi:micrococcal nuclease
MGKYSVLSLILGISLNLFAGLHPFIGNCMRIVDGDTVDVSNGGEIIRIRLEGIDCPERDQPFAEEAKAFTVNLILGKSVSVVEKEKDEYGRTVARVFIDGSDVSLELLKAGLATHFRKYNSDWLLATLEEQARADRVGMWASSTASVLAEKPIPLVSGTSPARITIGETSRAIYHGNTRSRVFHSPSCRDYNCKNCVREFRSRDEAIAAGFRPCGICRP